MSIKSIVLCVYLLSSLNLVLASDNIDPCNVSGGGALAAGMCIDKKIKVVDKELNKAYQESIERIKDEELHMGRDLEGKFRKSQRAWSEYRDSFCLFEGDSTGAAGGWSGIHVEECKLNMSLMRIKYLKEVFWG